MGPPAVILVLVTVLCHTATLPAGPLMVHAAGTSVVPNEDTATTPNRTIVDNQCSALQRRQDLLDNRMNDVDNRINETDNRLNGVDTRLSELQTQLTVLSTQLNMLDTRLSQQNEVNARLNRMDSQLDGIETAISDMNGFLHKEMEFVDKEEWALTDITPRPVVNTALPDTNPQQADNVTAKLQGFKGCEEALKGGMNTSGVLAPDHPDSFSVYCEQNLDGGGWTVFQSRFNGSVDFYNDWNTYKAGFGELTAEFWLGNKKIRRLTKHHNMQLKVELTSPAGEVEYADYSHFWIGNEAHKYRLYVLGYKGGSVPGDSLSQHHRSRFSTRDNDNSLPGHSCATLYKGGWWYDDCHYANLNGLYGGRHYTGMRWESWKGGLSMKATRMMMRRRT